LLRASTTAEKGASVVNKHRVVVWSTGGIGSLAIGAIHRRRDLELVGVWVHSEEKVGRDAGELAFDTPIRLAATNDAQALIDLRPDCVVYAASGPERDAAAVPTTYACSKRASTWSPRRAPTSSTPQRTIRHIVSSSSRPRNAAAHRFTHPASSQVSYSTNLSWC
jgi:hypothetical protein